MKDIHKIDKKASKSPSLLGKSSLGSKKQMKYNSSHESDEESDSLSSSEADRTIYVEGLPYSASEDDVRTHFKDVGDIESIRLARWHDSGRLRGYGHIVFQNVKSIKEALKLDGSFMKERYLKVEKPLTPRALQDVEKKDIKRPPGCKSVFVKNLPYDTNEEEIKEVMRVCGPIRAVRLANWGHTKQLKGFGYVDFQREDSAEIAVKKSGFLSVRDRILTIDFETGTPKRGFKNSNA